MPDRTPAETLRAAAQRLREVAADTSPGRWQTNGYGDYGWYVSLGTYGHGVETHDSRQGKADAEWIALASPALAEPLAEWLVAVAALQFGIVRLPDSPIVDHALAVAAVILGEAT
jgi:hypothetical protein